jgi:hypothetical protein
MSEADPFRERDGEPKPTTVKLDGPNVKCTLHTPPRADAVKAHEAAIRKHLKGRRRGDGPGRGAPGDSGAQGADS